MDELKIPMELQPGYVDPALREYIKKFRAYQRWVDGGRLTKDAQEIKAMLDRARMERERAAEFEKRT
jgi:hypothetical protein